MLETRGGSQLAPGLARCVASANSAGMRKLRTLVALAMAVLLVRWIACAPTAEKAPIKDLTDRVWVDKVPEGPRDMVLRLVLLGRTKKKRGVVFAASKYRLAGERLRYRVQENQLTIVLPQNKRTVTFAARTYACSDAPGRYDLCLELRHGRRTLRLYSERNASFERRDIPFLGGEPEASLDRAVDADEFDAELPAWFQRRAR